MEIYTLTLSEAISYSINRVHKSHPELSKKQVEALVKNALTYNVVIDEISEMVDTLLNGD